jgi:hypothetical protein
MRYRFASAAASAASLLVLAASQNVWAQSENSDAQAGIATYSADYFSEFSPVTALDMVQRIPGFSISDGNTHRRGLGDSFGNILIDGSRPANKSLGLSTILQRIPVSDVERIELVQEAMPQFDMRGHARLVNIVMREGAGSSGSWSLRSRLAPSGRFAPAFTATYTTTAGPTEMSFTLDGGYMGNRIRRRRSLFDGNDTLLEIQHDNDQRTYMEFNAIFSLNWTIDEQSSFSLDTRAQTAEWRRLNVSLVDEPGANGLTPLRLEIADADDAWTSNMVTATYQRDFGERFSMQTVALIVRDDNDNQPQTYREYDPVLGFVDAVIVNDRGTTEETAFRQTFSFDPNPNHSVEFGAELAVNARDSDLALFYDDGSTITPIDLPVAVTRVEETRSEVFANHVWTINDAWNLESGLRYESSEIVQSGDATQSRTLGYAKPSMTLNWRRDEHNRYRFSVQRDVDQLSFGKFASAVDVADNNSILGNPDYVPQRTWTVEGEWERRISEDASFSLLIGYDWIEDLDGYIAITTPTGIFDAPGNIGDGTNFRMTGNLTTPLDRLGLSNAVLDVFLEWWTTTITDPLTGVDRHFDGYREWEFAIDFRQTFPDLQIAWGWDYHAVTDGEIFRAQEYRVQGSTDGDLDLYIETTRWGGVTTRLGVDAVLNNGDDRQRVFYDGSRALGVIAGTEYRNESMGPTWRLQVRGTF